MGLLELLRSRCSERPLRFLGAAFLDAHGWGMSRQQGNVLVNSAIAASFAITCSLTVTHRLLAFPLMQSRTYVAITFASCFALVAVALKVLHIDFSNPNFSSAWRLWRHLLKDITFTNADLRSGMWRSFPADYDRLPCHRLCRYQLR